MFYDYYSPSIKNVAGPQFIEQPTRVCHKVFYKDNWYALTDNADNTRLPTTPAEDSHWDYGSSETFGFFSFKKKHGGLSH